MYHLFQYDFSFCIILYPALVILLNFSGVALLYSKSLLSFNCVLLIVLCNKNYRPYGAFYHFTFIFYQHIAPTELNTIL
jgi:hypothetical protein